MRSLLRPALAVWKKDLLEALRDRRALFIVLIGSVLTGPLVLWALSGMLAGLEARAERRVVMVSGAAHAPPLMNYLARQGYTVIDAPADHEAQLRSGRLGEPVLVIDDDFMPALARGDLPVLYIVSDSGNRRAEAGTTRLRRALSGFSSEQSSLALVMRGVAPAALDVLDLQERDLASVQARAAQLFAVLPFFVIMGVLYGALGPALETTAGERERGALTAQLLTPVPRGALVLGKWAAVACVSALVATLSVCSFIPAQSVLQGEVLASMFRFGPADAVRSLLLLWPLSAAMSAVLMAVGAAGRSLREAQVAGAMVMLFSSLLPLAVVMSDAPEQRWHGWMPVLAQHVLMNRLLRGEPWSAGDLLLPALVCAALCALALAWVRTRMVER
ncbi:ABC transporter permease [Methyloversatilis sp.]|uniref:ABC transporter permease n=1 Tax=Methyloversatilis sp. TaxID=2569862 RepID=UPI0035B17640